MQSIDMLLIHRSNEHEGCGGEVDSDLAAGNGIHASLVHQHMNKETMKHQSSNSSMLSDI